MNDNVEIWLQFASEDLSFSPEDLNKIQDLDAFYIPSRYPDTLPGMKAEGMPGKDDAREAIEAAETIFNLVKSLLF